MKIFNITFLIICILVVGCQNAEVSTNNITGSDSLNQAKTDILNQSPSFVFKYNPNKEMSDDEIMNALADKYTTESGNNNNCDCEEKTCYTPKISLKHYFKEDSKIKVLAVIGNNCSSEDASRVHSGWCDMALFEQDENGTWVMKNFWQEVGGGADWGKAGDAGEAIQVANHGIGIPVGWGSTAQGYTYEGVDILGYVNGNAKSLAKLQTHMDNNGAAIDDYDVECTCTRYQFKANKTSSTYDLHLMSKDCKKSQAENNCDGETLKEVTLEMGANGYDVPKGFNMW